MDLLNDNAYNLRFTYSYHQREIPFLNVMVIVDEDGNLNNSLYRKPSAGNSLLRYHSAHPIPLKRLIPFAQYLRIRRVCSTIEEFNKQA